MELKEQKDKYERAIKYMDDAIRVRDDLIKEKTSYYTSAKYLFDDVWLYQEAKVKSLECAKLIGKLKVKAERLTEQERLADEQQRLLYEKIRLRDKRKEVLTTVFSLLFVAFWVLLVLGVGFGWFL